MCFVYNFFLEIQRGEINFILLQDVRNEDVRIILNQTQSNVLFNRLSTQEFFCQVMQKQDLIDENTEEMLLHRENLKYVIHS